MWRVSLYRGNRWVDQIVFRSKSEALKQASKPIPRGYSVRLQKIQEDELF